MVMIASAHMHATVPDDVQWDEGFHAEVWVPEMHLYPEWPHNLAALSIK